VPRYQLASFTKALRAAVLRRAVSSGLRRHEAAPNQRRRSSHPRLGWQRRQGQNADLGLLPHRRPSRAKFLSRSRAGSTR